ncbi:centrosomal protein of 290 kDa-like [Astyanax mexicanus]|uniref:centrosomal protein of 290 kDa-like n=1 Tax=Astyanax mexicanus TaxID=7994 RepID=UPI0020CB3AD3|nr:centrosomal protein of 290 kDa-like [Astyanax mexicanus]XP_049324078.1 centrosomal protein of 290 kDa-like [Astyanax mexicanus]
MNAGIRQNWIQALLEKIQNRNAPDVTSVSGDQVILQAKAQRGPDVTQDSRLSSSRRAGPGAETSDWTEIGQIGQNGHSAAQEVNGEPELQDLQPEEQQQEEPENRILNRSRSRWEERRQRYELVMASSGLPVEDRTSQYHQDHHEQRMMEIEERWLQVEKISIRDGKKVLLYPESQSRSSADLEDVVEQHYQRTNSTNKTLESLEIPCKPQMMISPNMQNHISALTDKYLQTKQLLQIENLKRQHLKTQLSSELVTEAELKPVCRALGCEASLSESRLGSYGWREASQDREEERSEARVDGFSRGDAVTLLRKQNVGSDPAVVEQLEAVNRHNQELLNQLAEANRDIDRLKAELMCRQMNCSQQGLESVVESLKVELAGNSRELEVVQNRLAEVEENLKEAQKTLQLREATLKSLGFLGEDSDDTLLILSSSSTSDSSSEELRNKEMAKIGQCEQDLENHNLDQNVDQNALIRESTLLNSPKTMAAEGDQWETLEVSNNQEFQDVWRSSDGFLEEDVSEKMVQMRSNNLKMLLEIIRPLTRNWPNSEQYSLSDSDVLQLERNFWDGLVNALKKYNLSKSTGTEQAGSLVQCVQKKLDEIRMDLLALSINANNPHSQNSDLDQHSSNTFPNLNYLSNFDNTGLHNGSMEDHSVQKFRTLPVDEHLDNHPIWRGLKHHVEKKVALLNHVELASKLEPSTGNSPTNWAVCNQTEDSSKGLDPLVSPAMDIFLACLVGYHDAQNQEKTVKSIDEDFNSNIKGVDLYEGTLVQPNNMATQKKTGVNEEKEAETMDSSKSQIKELEHQLSRSEELISSLQQQHEEDQTNLKAVYEQRFTMLKKSHQKLIEDLLLQHQREQQRLMEEKDRLLAEETAATRTVIAALNRAHSSEMERVQQKTNWEKSNCDASIAEILKNHREELASVQSELEVLSVQFSQKCLESVHLAQALEAERKALQHCQHQNLALSTCNQDKKLVTEESRELQSDLGVVKERAEEQTGYLRENLRLDYEALSESEEQKTLLNS